MTFVLRRLKPMIVRKTKAVTVTPSRVDERGEDATDG